HLDQCLRVLKYQHCALVRSCALVDSTWSCEALPQLQLCHLFWLQPALAVAALEPLPEPAGALEVRELEAAVMAERLAAVEEVQVQALVVQLSPLRQASLPVLLTLRPDRRPA